MISGFTILNGVRRLGYPFEESLRSLLPLVDELIVNIGEIDDGTCERVDAIGDPRIHVMRTVWDWTKGSDVLSIETTRTLERCAGQWAVYLQADEVLHEDDLPALRRAIGAAPARAEGLVFDMQHFLGGVNAISTDWLAFYPRAVRAVRTGRGVVSTGDGAGFSLASGGGLIKARANARLFHYGWCNPPRVQVARAKNLTALYDPDRVEGTTEASVTHTDVRQVALFRGSHPAVMRARVGQGPFREGLRRPVLPAAWHAWSRVLRHPRATMYAARPFLPLALTNLYWRRRRTRTLR